MNGLPQAKHVNFLGINNKDVWFRSILTWNTKTPTIHVTGKV